MYRMPPFVYHETKTQKKVQNDKGKVEIVTETTTHRINLEASDINVDFDPHRKKGLLWYDTYKVNFLAKYTIKNPLSHQENFKINFSFPSQNAIYDNFRLHVNGKPIEINDFLQKTITIPVALKANEAGLIEIGYLSQGMDKWFYKFGETVSRIKTFL